MKHLECSRNGKSAAFAEYALLASAVLPSCSLAPPMIALQPSPSRARVVSCSVALTLSLTVLVLARSAAAGRAMPGSFPPEAGLGPKASRVTARIREELMPDFGMPHFQEFSLPELRGPQLPEPQMPQLQMPPLLSFDASPRQQPKRPTKSTKAQPPPANTAATPLAVPPSATTEDKFFANRIPTTYFLL